MTPVDPNKPPANEPIAGTKKKTGCGCGTSGDTGSLLVLAGMVLMLRRRKQTP
jgi:MYXO-CTERM domain-containing protein